MIKEAQDDSEIDQIRKADENRVWDKRDQQLRAREEARRRLLEIVHAGRQEQIEAKKKRHEEEYALEKEQRRNDALEHKRGVERDLEAAARRKRDCMDNNRLLLEQVAMREKARQDQRERERQEVQQWKADMEALDRRAEVQAGEGRRHATRSARLAEALRLYGAGAAAVADAVADADAMSQAGMTRRHSA
eukprot:scaffold2751_cov266-Pinguiococcus_pyrenoidosus.AAC.2